MAKKNNAKALAPSANTEWDYWGALCGFTSWATAAAALGITTQAIITARKKPVRKTMRLAMDAVLDRCVRKVSIVDGLASTPIALSADGLRWGTTPTIIRLSESDCSPIVFVTEDRRAITEAYVTEAVRRMESGQ